MPLISNGEVVVVGGGVSRRGTRWKGEVKNQRTQKIFLNFPKTCQKSGLSDAFPRNPRLVKSVTLLSPPPLLEFTNCLDMQTDNLIIWIAFRQNV